MSCLHLVPMDLRRSKGRVMLGWKGISAVPLHAADGASSLQQASSPSLLSSSAAEQDCFAAGGRPCPHTAQPAPMDPKTHQPLSTIRMWSARSPQGCQMPRTDQQEGHVNLLLDHMQAVNLSC